MVDIHGEFKDSQLFHQARIDRRSADALSGLAAGITADGSVNQREAEFLQDWISKNLIHLEDPVVNLLYRRLSDMLSDGVLDAEESIELLEMLHAFAGVSAAKPKASDNPFTPSNPLPLNAPEPKLEWSGSFYIFTGVMAYGPRKHCEEVVINRGGAIAPSISKKVSYLVVGHIGNDQWLHSTYGTKIKKAVELRDTGHPIAIVSEKHWQASLFGLI
ncbi:TPA: NAD-dependent DNA ligase [Pseudomonas aeruginosa]|uniref:BRCT domain-containing protein n=1 Tax=Pseudomonas aeruginosa TaxID=287 RepID=UPI0007094406|nr:BRCT domain-containing protein [Pseudomonas aeruginosa]EME5359054.1 BRCT domain-containing protein [Pseudomonas aeruginosa]MCO5623828.1 BRCT domain-containing protein [Pseudomonas aeruginosa]MDY1173887.1 BRCT domain-containing protein [Pseudomonas aeruginosa]HBP0911848.1 NAD-dependent DNA ligase [Pseudomonas aeruginosa]HBP4659001.1 NAD-dependent DNA ligase [Pseudomonas aeruginosa]